MTPEVTVKPCNDSHVENADNFVPEKQSAQEIMRAKLIKAQAIKLAYVAVERKRAALENAANALDPVPPTTP
jgi:hypothetical protein